MSKWHTGAIEVLDPLRFHLQQLVEKVEQHNRIAVRMYYPFIAKNEVDEAKDAMEAANNYFSPE